MHLGRGYVALMAALDTNRPGVAAVRTRVEESRAAIVFAALAAEAYVNEFMEHSLDAEDYRALRRLPWPPNKFVIGSKVAFGRPLIRRDEQIYIDLEALFKARNKLVHPTNHRIPIPDGPIYIEPMYEEHNPARAATYLVAVTAAARRLFQACSPPLDTNFLEALSGENQKRLVKLAEWVTNRSMPTRDEVEAELNALPRSVP